MSRWVCPNCGTAKLAPERARLDDTRRYCLPCSEQTGRLVERTCPAREKKSDERKARRKQKETIRASVETLRERTRHDVDGLDLRDELKRMWKLESIRERVWRVSKPTLLKRNRELEIVRVTRLPELVIRRGSARGTSGHANVSDHRIVLTIGTDCDRAEASGVLLHEIVHLATPKHSHDDVFWAAYLEAVGQAYGPFPSGTFSSFWTVATNKYERDAYIIAVIRILMCGSDARRDGAVNELMRMINDTNSPHSKRSL